MVNRHRNSITKDCFEPLGNRFVADPRSRSWPSFKGKWEFERWIGGSSDRLYFGCTAWQSCSLFPYNVYRKQFSTKRLSSTFDLFFENFHSEKNDHDLLTEGHLFFWWATADTDYKSRSHEHYVGAGGPCTSASHLPDLVIPVDFDAALPPFVIGRRHLLPGVGDRRNPIGFETACRFGIGNELLVTQK